MDILRKHNLTVDNLRTLYDCQELEKESYTGQIADLLGDMYLVEGYHKMIKHHVSKNYAPLYYYIFTYDKGISFTKLMMKTQISG